METVSRWKRLKIHQNTIHRYIKEYTSTSFTKERAELSPICCLLYSELFISGPNLFPWRRNQDKNVPILDIWLILVIMTQGSLRLHLVEDLSIIPLRTIVVIFLINIRLGRMESEKEKELSNLRLQNLRGSLRLGELERSQVSQNIAKGTTDPRVECVCLSSSAKHKHILF